MREGEDLTEEKIEIYLKLLMHVPLQALDIAFRKASQECTWFPAVAEIIERVPKEPDPSSSDRLHAAYKQAKREGRIPQSPYRSILEPSTQKLIADIVPDRQTRVRLGIEEPRQLSPIEHEMRVAELQKQAAELQEKSGVLHAAAGVGVGLL